MHEHEFRKCQDVWVSVLLRNVKDLVRQDVRGATDRRNVEAWVGTFPSSSFREVCSCAGVDYSITWRWFRNLCDVPQADRPAFMDQNGWGALAPTGKAKIAA